MMGAKSGRKISAANVYMSGTFGKESEKCAPGGTSKEITYLIASTQRVMCQTQWIDFPLNILLLPDKERYDQANPVIVFVYR